MSSEIKRKKVILGIIVPAYNEEEVIESTVEVLLNTLNSLEDLIDVHKSFIGFIDDGSNDNTWEVLKRLKERYGYRIRGIRLDKNYGVDIAIFAGLNNFKDFADCFVVIDADLQQDESKIRDFVVKYLKGYDIVLGIREGKYKFTSKMFYKLMKVLGTPIIENFSYYFLISKKVVYELAKFKERNFFLRGIIASIGFEKAFVKYRIKPRKLGVSKYKFLRRLFLAIDGIVSFSVVPLRLILLLGFFVLMVSFFMVVYVLYQKLIVGSAISGWASLMISIYFLCGVLIISLGIVGEYMARIYLEVKERPLFIIREEL